MVYLFVQCIREKKEPFFDVYRAAAMASAGILAWRSVLEGGKTFDIPDFRNEEERARWENDELSPFPDENGKVSLPCASEPYEPSAQDIEAAERDWKQG